MAIPRAKPLLDLQLRIYGQAGRSVKLWQRLLAERIAAEPNTTNHWNNQTAAVLAMGSNRN
jgi:hypothetical protein